MNSKRERQAKERHREHNNNYKDKLLDRQQPKSVMINGVVA